MKLQFDPKQEFQIDAVNSVVNLFDGQPLNNGDFQISEYLKLFIKKSSNYFIMNLYLIYSVNF